MNLTERLRRAADREAEYREHGTAALCRSAEARIRALTEALSDFGEHSFSCELDPDAPQPGSIARPSKVPPRCTCGLDALLRGEPTQERV